MKTIPGIAPPDVSADSRAGGFEAVRLHDVAGIDQGGDRDEDVPGP
jgi:hypothetical protein